MSTLLSLINEVGKVVNWVARTFSCFNHKITVCNTLEVRYFSPVYWVDAMDVSQMLVDASQDAMDQLCHSQLAFTCSKSTIETLEKGEKYISSLQ